MGWQSKQQKHIVYFHTKPISRFPKMELPPNDSKLSRFGIETGDLEIPHSKKPPWIPIIFALNPIMLPLYSHHTSSIFPLNAIQIPLYFL